MLRYKLHRRPLYVNRVGERAQRITEREKGVLLFFTSFALGDIEKRDAASLWSGSCTNLVPTLRDPEAIGSLCEDEEHLLTFYVFPQ